MFSPVAAEINCFWPGMNPQNRLNVYCVTILRRVVRKEKKGLLSPSLEMSNMSFSYLVNSVCLHFTKSSHCLHFSFVCGVKPVLKHCDHLHRGKEDNMKQQDWRGKLKVLSLTWLKSFRVCLAVTKLGQLLLLITSGENGYQDHIRNSCQELKCFLRSYPVDDSY